MISEINLTPTCSYFDIASHSRTISGRSWGTPKECHSAILLVHGLGAHSGWFEALGRRLKVKGIYAVSYDQLGFGKRRTEKLESYEQWLEDLSYIYKMVEKECNDKPLYLAGNSMGAVVASAIAGQIKPPGLVLFSPGFDGNPETFKLSFKLYGLACAFFAPDKEIALPYASDFVSQDAAAQAFMDSDPLRRFNVPASMLLELLKLTGVARRQVKQLQCPTLMLTAGRDKIVSNVINAEAFAQIPAKVKQQVQFDNAFHDLMFDPDIDQVIDQVSDWIKLGACALPANSP